MDRLCRHYFEKTFFIETGFRSIVKFASTHTLRKFLILSNIKCFAVTVTGSGRNHWRGNLNTSYVALNYTRMY